jgi:CTP:molybdopterin cytidylyltransferase MocA
MPSFALCLKCKAEDAWVGVLGEVANVPTGRVASAPAEQMSWRWLCVPHVQSPLQESLNQAGTSWT